MASRGGTYIGFPFLRGHMHSFRSYTLSRDLWPHSGRRSRNLPKQRYRTLRQMGWRPSFSQDQTRVPKTIQWIQEKLGPLFCSPRIKTVRQPPLVRRSVPRHQNTSRIKWKLLKTHTRPLESLQKIQTWQTFLVQSTGHRRPIKRLGNNLEAG